MTGDGHLETRTSVNSKCLQYQTPKIENLGRSAIKDR